MTQQQQVTNIGQAISVLIQATDLGRKAGIYEWEDLDLISQAKNLLTPKKVISDTDEIKETKESSNEIATEE